MAMYLLDRLHCEDLQSAWGKPACRVAVRCSRELGNLSRKLLFIFDSGFRLCMHLEMLRRQADEVIGPVVRACGLYF